VEIGFRIGTGSVPFTVQGETDETVGQLRQRPLTYLQIYPLHRSEPESDCQIYAVLGAVHGVLFGKAVALKNTFVRVVGVVFPVS